MEINDVDHIRTLAQMVVIPGVKGDRLAAGLLRMGDRVSNGHVDRIPLAVNAHILSQKVAVGMSWSKLGYRVQGKAIGRTNLARVADRLGDRTLSALARSDVLWDRVESIVADGEEDTYDLSVPGIQSFVANNVCCHNSGELEQDADTVLLVHRATREAAEVEVIVAKQRSGPTGIAPLVFEGATTRFLDAARSWDVPPDDGN